MRLIDADLFVQKVAKHFTQPNYHPDADAFIAMEAEQHNDYIHGFIEDIEEQPTVEVDKWIICSERLPETSDWYLVTKSFLIGDGNEVSLLWYGDIGNGNHFYCEELPIRENIPLGQRALEFDCLIIAWQPKPEKYTIE